MATPGGKKNLGTTQIKSLLREVLLGEWVSVYILKWIFAVMVADCVPHFLGTDLISSDLICKSAEH